MKGTLSLTLKVAFLKLEEARLLPSILNGHNCSEKINLHGEAKVGWSEGSHNDSPSIIIITSVIPVSSMMSPPLELVHDHSLWCQLGQHARVNQAELTKYEKLTRLS